MESFDRPDSSPALRREDRLDSWKEIAVYLERDIRTVQRWERREGLPVHRHLHDRLSSVYASKSELDQWRARRAPEIPGNDSDQATGETSAQLVAFLSKLWNRMTPAWWAGVFTALAALIIVAVYVSWRQPPSRLARLTYEGDKLFAHDTRNAVVWSLPITHLLTSLDNSPGYITDADGSKEVLAATTHDGEPPSGVRSGQINYLTSGGKRLWQFALNDNLRFGRREFGPPWPIDAWKLFEAAGGIRVAVAAHD